MAANDPSGEKSSRKSVVEVGRVAILERGMTGSVVRHSRISKPPYVMIDSPFGEKSGLVGIPVPDGSFR